MAQLPTIEDVAAASGVSRQTVSNVLNSPEIVRPETRERVQEAIDRLGYRPHAAARRLRTRQSSTIGIRMDPVTNGISGSVLDRYLHALTELSARRGMRVTLYTATDPDDELRQLRDLRDGADVDAIVLTSTFFGDPRARWLVNERVPFVSFGRPWGEEARVADDHRWVDVDGRAGVAEATRHLVDTGHQRIGFFGWPLGSATGDERRRGWVETLASTSGLDADDLERRTIRLEDRVPDARRAMEEVLAADAVDALVCVSDSLALGALMAVTEAGRRDVPVIGFDNTPIARAVGLSSVDQQLDLVAAATLDLLMGSEGRHVLAADEIPEPAPHRLVTPKLIVRRSSHLAVVEEGGSNPAATERGKQ